MAIGADPVDSHRELGLTDEAVRDMYRLMALARRVDDRLWALRADGEVPLAVAASGREAVQVGAAYALNAAEDWVVPHYRDLALMVALGTKPEEVFHAFLGRQPGPGTPGRLLPGHWSLPGRRVLSRSPAPGPGFPHAAGIAYELRRTGRPGVVLATGGEDALAQGALHEALNFAALHRLPVIFLMEIDHLPGSEPAGRQTPGDPAERARAYDMAGITVDGNGVFDVYREVSWAAERARAGEGPTLIEAHIYPYYAQTADRLGSSDRTAEEITEWRRRDPLGRLRSYLVEHRLLTEAEEERFDQESAAQVAAALASARQAPGADEAAVPVYARPPADAPPADAPEEAPPGEEMDLLTALNRALHDLLAEYPQTLVVGEGESRPGAPGEATAGLVEAFGRERCFDAPAAGASLVGVAVGLAAAGAQPIVEIRSADLMHAAFHQIVAEAAQLNYRSGGGWSCPLVIRLPYGDGLLAGPYPGRPIEGLFAHVPGLKVVVPSTPADAAGLLRTAVEDPDPVLFLEPARLYRSARGPVPAGPHRVPLGRAALRRRGDNLTIITYGGAAYDTLEAAGRLAEQGIEAEVLDLRTIRPLDWASVEAAVQRTGKVLIVHEASRFAGFGAEVAAEIGERLFEWLDAPVRRYAAQEVPAVAFDAAPASRAMPTVEGIVAQATDLAAF